MHISLACISFQIKDTHSNKEFFVTTLIFTIVSFSLFYLRVCFLYYFVITTDSVILYLFAAFKFWCRRPQNQNVLCNYIRVSVNLGVDTSFTNLKEHDANEHELKRMLYDKSTSKHSLWMCGVGNDDLTNVAPATTKCSTTENWLQLLAFETKRPRKTRLKSVYRCFGWCFFNFSKASEYVYCIACLMSMLWRPEKEHMCVLVGLNVWSTERDSGKIIIINREHTRCMCCNRFLELNFRCVACVVWRQRRKIAVPHKDNINTEKQHVKWVANGNVSINEQCVFRFLSSILLLFLLLAVCVFRRSHRICRQHTSPRVSNSRWARLGFLYEWMFT